MATQQPVTSEQKKETERSEIEVTRGGLERFRPRNWLGLPRLSRRSWLSPYEPFSPDMWWSPFEAMRRMSDDLDRMFAEVGFPGDTGIAYPESFGAFQPEIEVLQRGDEFIVRADVPGLNKDDLRVEIVNNNLVLEGERRYETERKGAGYYRTERSYGSFRRSIPLPEGAREAEPTATYEAGVLEVRMKNLQGRGKRIEIKGGEAPKIH